MATNSPNMFSVGKNNDDFNKRDFKIKKILNG